MYRRETYLLSCKLADEKRWSLVRFIVAPRFDSRRSLDFRALAAITRPFCSMEVILSGFVFLRLDEILHLCKPSERITSASLINVQYPLPRVRMRYRSRL